MPYFARYTNDYLIANFTLAELRMLKRKTRYTERNPYFNHEYGFVTLEECIEMLLQLNSEFPRRDLS